MNVSKGTIASYVLLPGILPRLYGLFGAGFHYLSYYVAFICRSVRLLPPDHPYLNPAHFGRYGIRHVLFEARRNLVFSRENSDQVIIFFSLIFGVMALFLQFMVLIFALVVPNALAGDFADYVGTFFGTNQDSTYDLSFRLLDLVFGFDDPAIFNSCVAQGVECQLIFREGGGHDPTGNIVAFPTAFHGALHSLYNFYNTGLLAIAFIIFIYMIVTLVAETAQSGTPFGKRFNGFWAPMRMIFAVVLLIPFSYGLNGAQLMTLYVAKWGSNLATNGWVGFMTPLSDPVLGPATTLVARPGVPTVTSLAELMFIAHACKHYESFVHRRDIDAYLIGNTSLPLGTTGYNAALGNVDNRQIVVRFGQHDPEAYHDRKNFVGPVCGEITLNTEDVSTDGAMLVQEAYYQLVRDMWQAAGAFAMLDFHAENIVLRLLNTADRNPVAPEPPDDFVRSIQNEIIAYVRDVIDDAVDAQAADPKWETDYTVLGWGGAGLWYQVLAEMNGSFFSSIKSLPYASMYPEVMEKVLALRKTHDAYVGGSDRFNPMVSSGAEVNLAYEDDLRAAAIYYYAQSLWPSESYAETSGNVFNDAITNILGLDGLFNIYNNADIHPMAMLTGLGRTLLQSSLDALGIGAGSGALGGGLMIFGGDGARIPGTVALSFSSFFGQVGLIGLGIGFILYYILPFLPFIYFFFAVGGWVKGIFEAMVGLPLWALAHLRIDGEGLPGPAAMNGYMLIFEIMIRPLLTVFGLLAGIVIFAAQVNVLHDIWPLVTANVAGASAEEADMGMADGILGAAIGDPTAMAYMRGHIDTLFYMVMYTIVVWMLAMSSFKLIDLIPNHIMRWLGSSVSTFGEQAGDPAQGFLQYAWMGSRIVSSKASGALQGLASRAS